MPAQSLKPSTDQKRKKVKKRHERLVKRIRVIVSDPDATDSSSDDDGERVRQGRWYKSPGTKRCIKEVVMFEACPPPLAETNPCAGDQKRMRLKSKYPGVRQRESGRWAAEIRNPVEGVRQWLGTYDTEEEAHSAHERKRLEFEAVKNPGKETVSEALSSASHPSPCSVLDDSSSAASLRGKKERFDMQGKRAFGEDISAVLDEVKQYRFAFLDELRHEDFAMCNLGDLADLPGSDSLLEMGKEDFSWLDEALDFTGL